MMYMRYFGMDRMPFVKNIPPEYLYQSAAMKEVLGRLKMAVDNQKFAVFIADSGCGKSTALRQLVNELPAEQYRRLYVADSKLTPRWMYASFLDQLGLAPCLYRGDAKQQLQKQISVIRDSEHRKVVCILDEAHLLEKETLEEFRFLLNSNFDSESPMSLILCGQTELWTNKLRYQNYTAIRERIEVMCVLPHLSREETESYIKSHMIYAGCKKDIFDKSAYDEIFRHSGGVMRRINRMCDNTLMYASQKNIGTINAPIVKFVCKHEMLGTDPGELETAIS